MDLVEMKNTKNETDQRRLSVRKKGGEFVAQRLVRDSILKFQRLGDGVGNVDDKGRAGESGIS